MWITEEDGKILQQSNIRWLYIQAIICFLTLGFITSIFVVYCIETGWGGLLRMLVWFSYLAIILAWVTVLVCLISTLNRILIFQLHETMKLPEFMYWWMSTLDGFRDLLLVMSYVITFLSHIAFWITWYLDSWPITYPSIVGHTLVFPSIILMMFITTMYVSWWALLFTSGYCIFYFFYHTWIWYNGGFWVYPSLDPHQDPFYVYLVGGIFIGQILLYFVVVVINHFKNKFFALLVRSRVVDWEFFTIVYEKGMWRNEHNRTELLISQGGILILLGFLGFMSVVNLSASTLFTIHFIFNLIYMGFSGTSSLWNLNHIFRKPRATVATNLEKFQFVVWTNMIDMVCLWALIMYTICEVIIYVNTNSIWVFLAFLTIYLMMMVMKVIQYFFAKEYFDYDNTNIHVKDKIMFSTYFTR